MARSVGTVSLLRASVASEGPGPAVSCPTGQTIIVKSLLAINSAAGSVGLQLVLVASREGFAMTAQHPVIPTSETLYLPIWFVLNGGDVFYIYADDGPVSYWVSGTLITGAAPWVTPTRSSINVLPA